MANPTANRPRSSAEVLKTLDLQARLAAAMSKVGFTTPIHLEVRGISQDFYDVSGIQVVVDVDDLIAERYLEARAVAWLQAALRKAGVKQWHTGGWHGPAEMGDPQVIRTKVYGEPVTLVAINTTSIGD